MSQTSLSAEPQTTIAGTTTRGAHEIRNEDALPLVDGSPEACHEGLASSG